MPVRSRASAVVAMAAAAICTTGACSGPSAADEGPEGSRTTTTVTTASPPATTRAATAPSTTQRPAVPPEASQHTDAGAAAFATFYVQQIDLAARDADPSTLRQLVDSRCGGCSSVIGLVEGLKSKGQHHTALSFTIARSVWSPFSTDRMWVIDVLIDDAGATTVDSAGATVSTSPAAKFTLRNSLEWRASGWIVIKSVLVQ
jgi:hypothetical protein